MYQIILNPVAGKKKALKNLQEVERLFSERNISYQVHKSDSAHDAENIARKLTQDGGKNLIVLGGDGTLHEVLNGIVDPSQGTLGLIPSGTGNDFAQQLGLSLDAEKATLQIINGEAKYTNYLEIGDRRCMNVAGLGMDVDVLERCQRGKMKGKLKYLKSLIQSIFKFKGYPILIERDGKEERHDALIAAACNGAQFGGGIKICPTAKVDDDKIEVIVVETIGGRWRLIKALITLLKGKILQYPATSHYQCERLRIIPDRPCTVQLDGELYTGLDFNVKIRGGLKFYY